MKNNLDMLAELTTTAIELGARKKEEELEKEIKEKDALIDKMHKAIIKGTEMIKKLEEDRDKIAEDYVKLLMETTRRLLDED